MTDDLVVWLRAQLDEDEQVIRRNLGRNGLGDDGDYPDYQSRSDDDTNADDDYLSRFRSPRMLVEVEAKRRILDLWEASQDNNLPPDALIVLDHVVQLVGVAHAAQPGYREEWRP